MKNEEPLEYKSIEYEAWNLSAKIRSMALAPNQNTSTLEEALVSFGESIRNKTVQDILDAIKNSVPDRKEGGF